MTLARLGVLRAGDGEGEGGVARPVDGGVLGGVDAGVERVLRLDAIMMR